MRRRIAIAIATAGLSVGAYGQSGDAIVPVRENGRIIFINNEAAAPAASRSRTSLSSAPLNTQRLVYWSNTEKRWKRVPTPSASALRSARSAAQEVSEMVASSPSSSGMGAPSAGRARRASAPDTRELTAGHSISQHTVDVAITGAAARHNVDENLVRAIIKVESNFNPRAVSRKGAVGLMQLMPATARDLNVRNPYDPVQNVDGGVRHFKGLLNNFGGDVRLSLAAYNAGQGAVERNGGVPPYRETRNYVQKITEMYGTRYAFTMENGLRRTPIRTTRDGWGRVIYTNE